MFFVSILVMLEVKWKESKVITKSAPLLVSILVMLEVKWKDAKEEVYMYHY